MFWARVRDARRVRQPRLPRERAGGRLRGPLGNSLLTNAAALWADAALGCSAFVGDDGTLTCRYLWLGSAVTAEIGMTLGSNAALHAGDAWTWSLPVTPAAAALNAVVGTAIMRNASVGGADYAGVAFCATSSNVCVLVDGWTRGVGARSPFAWQAGDALHMQLVYEASGVAAPASALPVAWVQSTSNSSMGLGVSPGSTAAASSLVVKGFVGVGGVVTPRCALDVSGSVYATAYRDASGNALITNAMAMWSPAAVTFQDDAGGPLSCGIGANGSLTCRHYCLGTMVNATIAMVLGDAPSLALGTSARAWTWTLPLPLASSLSSALVGTALLTSAHGEGTQAGTAVVGGDGLVRVLLADGASCATVDAPFAWAPGDALALSLSYEAAAAAQPAYATPVAFLQSGASSNTLGLGVSPAPSLPAGSLALAGALSAPAFAGGCISDSLTSSSSSTCASAAALSNVSAVALAALPKAGGAIAGSLTVLGTLVTSNLAVVGAIEVVSAYETHSSNVVIANAGTGPALVVTQTGSQPVAAFYAGPTGSNVALLVDGSGNVGIGKSSPLSGFALDVSGSLRATNVIRNYLLYGVASAGGPNLWINFAGGALVDATENGYSVSFSGAYTATSTTTTPMGHAVNFLQYTNASGSGLTTNFPAVAGAKTIAFWINTTRSGGHSDLPAIGFCGNATGSTGTTFGTMFGAAGYADLSLFTFSSDFAVNSSAFTWANTGAWTHIVVTMDLCNMVQLFVNGCAVSRYYTTGSVAQGSGTIYSPKLAANATNTSYVFRIYNWNQSGSVAYAYRNMLCYNRCLSPEEITGLYFAT